ncbi:hypothetical protein [Blastochloris viridis]|uniref:Uncharacterized protein n=1 Tax=Blastochloris viridis TaxID=1079 RepID=A0A0H5BEF4_BLAVI|nr:hypothetical protein [Blastochloris viridis]ALK09518.1 hypothetical protein BVIR_1743 [Blastochloris viridis]BAS00596.1 hypothetical protein BV133_3002 [Blastochloris viridis]CUU42181.1 hypothetical protein BVIRIDIS_11880 [Blastochloris viridis]
MARSPIPFAKQALTRAIKATVDAGVASFRVTVRKGGDIEIDIGKTPSAAEIVTDDTSDNVRALI